MTAIGDLMVALLQVFGTVLLGVIVFRLQVLTPADMKGIGWLIGNVLFPIFIFRRCATLIVDLDWSVVIAVVLSKYTVMVILYSLPVLILRQKPTRFLTAASLMATGSMSNDGIFAIPVTKALFPSADPSTPSPEMNFLFGILVHNASIHTVILISAFAFGASKRDAEEASALMVPDAEHSYAQPQDTVDPTINVRGRRGRGLCSSVLLSLGTNPIFGAAVLGLLVRFVPPVKRLRPGGALALPTWLDTPLVTLEGAYTPTVLFLLGMVVNENLDGLRHLRSLMLPLFVTAVKLIVSPILMLLFVGLFFTGSSSNLYRAQMFAVLFGLIPSSEVAVVLGKQYNFVTPDMAAIVTLTHLLSGPLIMMFSIYLQPVSLAGSFYDIRWVITFVNLALLLVLMVTFMLVGRRWMRHPMASHLVVALVLTVYFIVQQFMSPGDCTSQPALYALRQASRLASDLMILVLAVQHTVHLARGPSAARSLSMCLVSFAVVLPCLIFGSAFALQDLRPVGKFDDPCYAALPIEDVLSPATRALCLAGSVLCLMTSVATQGQNSDEVASSHAPVSTEAVYLLVGLAVLMWLQQLVLDLTQPSASSYSTKFFIFASAVMYNFFGIVHCLVLALRGDGITGWKNLLTLPQRDGCTTQDPESIAAVA